MTVSQVLVIHKKLPRILLYLREPSWKHLESQRKSVLQNSSAELYKSKRALSKGSVLFSKANAAFVQHDDELMHIAYMPDDRSHTPCPRIIPRVLTWNTRGESKHLLWDLSALSSSSVDRLVVAQIGNL